MGQAGSIKKFSGPPSGKGRGQDKPACSQFTVSLIFASSKYAASVNLKLMIIMAELPKDWAFLAEMSPEQLDNLLYSKYEQFYDTRTRACTD